MLDEYRSFWPLQVRQIMYRLVGAHGYEKSPELTARLEETLNMARRAGLIPWNAIRDDGAVCSEPDGFSGMADFRATVRSTAKNYRRDRSEGQSYAKEVWGEAVGMVPQLARVAHPVGASVYSSGGFDTTTAKHDAAQRIAARERTTVVLHVGDYDMSGCSIIDRLKTDVTAFVEGLGGPKPIFVRVSVTPEQIERHGLPTAPSKEGNKRGNWSKRELRNTVQAEALAPDQLAAELRSALYGWVNNAVLEDVLEQEKRERHHLVRQVARLGSRE